MTSENKTKQLAFALVIGLVGLYLLFIISPELMLPIFLLTWSNNILLKGGK